MQKSVCLTVCRLHLIMFYLCHLTSYCGKVEMPKLAPTPEPGTTVGGVGIQMEERMSMLFLLVVYFQIFGRCMTCP